jgi:hypothetical protein
MMHVFAVPAYIYNLDTPVRCGQAASITAAKRLIRAAGYRVMTRGGQIDQYDAQDGPGVYGYPADGMGAVSITVHPKTGHPQGV